MSAMWSSIFKHMRELDQKISRIKQLRVKPYSRLWQVILQLRVVVNSSFVSGVFVLFNKNNVQRLGFRDCSVVCEMMVILIDQAKTNIEVQGFYIALTTVYQTKPR